MTEQHFYRRFPPEDLISLLTGIKMRLDPTLRGEIEDRRGEMGRPYQVQDGTILQDTRPDLRYRPFRYDPEAPYGTRANPDDPPEPFVPTDSSRAADKELADLWDLMWTKPMEKP